MWENLRWRKTKLVRSIPSKSRRARGGFLYIRSSVRCRHWANEDEQVYNVWPPQRWAAELASISEHKLTTLELGKLSSVRRDPHKTSMGPATSRGPSPSG
jgi:hypothetical protein